MKNDEKIKQHFAWLGFVCRDVVTGFEGVADSLSFDLYGCIQIALRPKLNKDAKPGEYSDGRWFDVGRLKKVGKKPVMTVPDFLQWDEKGPATKPEHFQHVNKQGSRSQGHEKSNSRNLPSS